MAKTSPLHAQSVPCAHVLTLKDGGGRGCAADRVMDFIAAHAIDGRDSRRPQPHTAADGAKTAPRGASKCKWRGRPAIKLYGTCMSGRMRMIQVYAGAEAESMSAAHFAK